MLGVAAVTLIKEFRDLAVNPWVNVALAFLFVFFAMSLFGMFDIVLPSFLVRATSSQEGRGGYLGTIFMAAFVYNRQFHLRRPVYGRLCRSGCLG